MAGLSQSELADMIDISRRSVTNYEQGHQQPHRPVILAWALATGVSLAWLLDSEPGTMRELVISHRACNGEGDYGASTTRDMVFSHRACNGDGSPLFDTAA